MGVGFISKLVKVHTEVGAGRLIGASQ
jgi:hypothetical protein